MFGGCDRRGLLLTVPCWCFDWRALALVSGTLAFGEKLGREPLALRDALDFDGDRFDRPLDSLETTCDLRRNARILRICVDLPGVGFRQRNSNCKDDGRGECPYHDDHLGYHV